MALTFRFLFDECLSPSLVPLAIDQGHEATHVRNLGRLGDSDSTLSLFARDRDWVFVTQNRSDYVRLYRRFELHPGLIIIIPRLKKTEQSDLFVGFLAELQGLGDLVNKLVDIQSDGSVEVQDWPPLAPNDPNP